MSTPTLVESIPECFCYRKGYLILFSRRRECFSQVICSSIHTSDTTRQFEIILTRKFTSDLNIRLKFLKQPVLIQMKVILFILCCAILCYTELYIPIVLYYIVLYCAMYIVSYCAMLDCTILYFNVLCCVSLYCMQITNVFSVMVKIFS